MFHESENNPRDAAIFFYLLAAVLFFFSVANCFGQVQIESPSEIARFKSLLPAVDQPWLQEIFDDPNTLWYSHVSMPPAYQLGLNIEGKNDADNIATRFADPNHNNSGDPGELDKPDGVGGNANVDFPWARPGGTSKSKNTDSFKFLWLPKKPDGSLWPVVWYRRDFPKQFDTGFIDGYDWLFPRGSVLGELLTMQSPRGDDYTFEIRTRTRGEDQFEFAVLSPFPTRESLLNAIFAARPNWRGSPDLTSIIWSLSGRDRVPSMTLVDSNPDRKAFEVSAGVDELPEMPSDLVTQLMANTEFQECFGEVWHEGLNGVDAFAPTTQAVWHIVPTHYRGGYLISCNDCHDSAGMKARTFDEDRGWYGYVKGSRGEGILSWHPVDPSRIGRGATRRVKMRDAFEDGGILERFTRVRHPESMYRRVR